MTRSEWFVPILISMSIALVMIVVIEMSAPDEPRHACTPQPAGCLNGERL